MNENVRIRPEEVEEVYPEVAGIVADALAVDLEEISPESRLIHDLNAESIDFLDIVYRLERKFGVKIPRGRIEAEVRGSLREDEFEEKGVLTEAALERLRDYMEEIPPERIRRGLKVVDIPLLFTVETFCRTVVRARRAPDG